MRVLLIQYGFKVHPQKLTWLAGNKKPFEDVFPTENGGIFQCHVRLLVGNLHPSHGWFNFSGYKCHLYKTGAITHPINALFFHGKSQCSRIFASNLVPPKMCHNLNSLYWGWLSHPWYGILIMGIYTPIIGLMTIPHTPQNHHGSQKWKFGRVFSFSNTCSGRWLQRPIWKIWSSKWVHLSPIFGVNIKHVWVATA